MPPSQLPGQLCYGVWLAQFYEAVRTAIRVCKRLNLPMEGSVRLDSGDLGALSKAVQQELIDACFIILTDGLVKAADSVRVAASNGLTVSRITELEAEQAPIVVYGVGDNIHVLAKPFGGVMKLTAVHRGGQWGTTVQVYAGGAGQGYPAGTI